MCVYGEPKGKEQRGGATVISLVMVLAAFILSSTYLSLAQAELRMTTRNIQAKQALYLAEAGVELSRAELATSSLWRPVANYPMQNGSFTLVVAVEGSGYSIISTGKAGEAVKKLQVHVDPAENGWKMTLYREVYN